MPILDGSIDKLLKEERTKMQKYLKDQVYIDIGLDDRDERLIEKIKKGLGEK